MADTPPISTEVPEVVSVDTRADPESTASLNASFEDFWKAEDEKEHAPSAPDAPGPAQETKEAKETKAEGKPEEKTEPEPPRELPDEDIEKLELANHNLKPEIQEKLQDNFRSIKELWKGDRAKLKAEAERAKKLEAQLEEAKQNSWTPEAKADYEHAAQVRRRFDFVSDPEFIEKYHNPIKSQFESVLAEAVQVLPDRGAAQQWADFIKANYTPEQLNREWWLHSVVGKIPDELDRSSVLNSVTELLKLQKDRDGEIHKRTNDKSSFDNWIAEKADNTQKRVQQEIMDEIGVQEKRIQEVLPRDVAAAKTKEEKAAIEAHNERFEKLNKFFIDTMQDLSKHGPKAWVRASVEATRSMFLETQYKELEKELKTVKGERDQYKTELDKITGARRKISHTTGTPPTNNKDKKSDGLSIKDLDIRKSFQNFDWGDNA